MRLLVFFLSIVMIGCSDSKDQTLPEILKKGSARFQQTLTNPDHEIQIIYGRITLDTITHEGHNVDPEKFFYPASTVKMPVAFAALQKLAEENLSLDSRILIDSSEHNPRRLIYDSLFSQEPTVRNLVSKIFTFSDNQAYNVLYGWLGKDYINELNQRIGLSSSRLIHQLSESAFSFTSESNRNTFQATLIDGEKRIEFTPFLNSYKTVISPKNQIRGLGYMNNDGVVVEEPFNFSKKNFITLSDLLGCLERVVKPELFELEQRYSFKQKTYDDLKKIMLMRPKNLPAPIDTLGDNYVKFFMFGDQEDGAYPDHIEIRNKVGWAYGYLTDVAHIRDREKNIEFFLAATIHVNENKIYNDGKYEYEKVGLPFLAELGRLVYKNSLY